MISYDQESLFHFFDGEPFPNSMYCVTVTPNDVGFYDEQQYGRESHYDLVCSNMENDEIIPHALQEQLSQLTVVEEASGSTTSGEEHFQSVLGQDWFGPSMRNYNSGHECGQEDIDDAGASSSCSSPAEAPYDGEEWYSLEITDESSLDGEVGKRLNQMVPIPHVPRINGEIPSVDEAISDHQRLLDRLQLYGLVELKVQGDGNCQFRALSDQFYRTPEHHKFVRQHVVNQLKSHPEIYEGYVPMAYSDYLKRMSKPGEWGDHVTLQAAADSLFS
ncbi:PREDICTED: OTU domain-containing protein DDB_G0284757 isoform X2 [Nelumbo nucifera]|uniref:OTU domain-containing protein DDB_G0284757 isoform X2 n=1 Tax=Nelumbo nucifera TaxID=4432 RepID=A0A1U7Z4Z3_NELNU|nr:PREDICTED: OTU domain-containing protein DDB_G0284757 isoform X2 [Nelumbo nucifera]